MRATVKNSIAASLILCASQSIYAEQCSTKSGMHMVPLLELYTSEGCSSCPPADKWLSSLEQDSSKFVRLAFHVDYWDYIGWKDRFSKSEYTNRQRKTAAFGGAGFVYTPQFVLNGRDFRGWDNSRLRDAVARSQKIPSRTDLSLWAEAQANGEILLRASAQMLKPEDAKQVDIFVALYENKLVSKVNAGENNGRELKHDYVVRELFGAYQPNNLSHFSKDFVLQPAWKGRDAGAVMFVQNNVTGEIIQSLALKLCAV